MTSLPPRKRFSLTSAGTKIPGQVSPLFTGGAARYNHAFTALRDGRRMVNECIPNVPMQFRLGRCEYLFLIHSLRISFRETVSREVEFVNSRQSLED
jgi:hypothetical protein